MSVHEPARAPRVLRLPSRGTLLVSTDLQGSLRDWERLLMHFHTAEEATGGEAVLVLTGDLVHGPDDETYANWPEPLGTKYRDESVALVEAFLREQQRAPGRVHCLLGNHDHAHIGGPVTSKFYLDEAAALESRLDVAGVERLKATIRGFPLVAVAPCGVVLLHGSPSAEISGPQDIEALKTDGFEEMHYSDFLRVPVLGPLLWSRMARLEEAERFVIALGGSVAIFGHDIVREGYAKDDARQLCVSTSFGCLDENKVYVQLDLGATYSSTADLREGVELLKLYQPLTPTLSPGEEGAS